MKTFPFPLLFIILSLLTTPINSTNTPILTDIFDIFQDAVYQPSSNQTILNRISVQSKIQCAGKCLQSSSCQVVIFDPTTKLCSLFTDYTNLGQITQHNQTTTFVRKVKPSSTGWNSTGITVAGIIGSPGVAANQLYHPHCAIIDSFDTLYVSDQFNQRVQKWLTNASSATTVAGQSSGTAGSALNLLSRPTELTIDSSGNLYIVDGANSRVVRWNNGSSSGTVVAGSGGYGSANNQLMNPTGITRDSSTGTLYISDSDNHRVMQYLSGALSGMVVAGGNGAGTNITQLNSPRGLYFDLSTNSLLIANNKAHNIVRWVIGDSSWTLVVGSSSGVPGASSTMLSYPTSIVLDLLGNMIVSDEGNHRIQYFLSGQSNGTTIAGVTGVSGNTSQLLETPSSVAVDSQLNIYVTEYNSHYVKKFLHY